MTAARRRARRGEIGLIRLPQGTWGIRWGRKLQRELGVPVVESTQTTDEREAARILAKRRRDVFIRLGAVDEAEVARRQIHEITLRQLVSAALRAYADGELQGRQPSRASIENATSVLLGKRGGLVTFADEQGKRTSRCFDDILVTRWLEREARRVSNDSLRLRLIAARKVATFAKTEGYIDEASHAAIHRLRRPPASRGRARVDGVPCVEQVEELVRAMAPRRDGAAPYHRLAELQFRLGLRRGEVLALKASWLDERRAIVRVTVDDDFATKSHESREIGGVDIVTFALARGVLAAMERFEFTAVGYRMAFKRACERLERAGTPWTFRNKTHALRAAYATASRRADVPLSVVRERMGHASERTTEHHYLGRMRDDVQAPFANQPLFDLARGEPKALTDGSRRAG